MACRTYKMKISGITVVSIAATFGSASAFAPTTSFSGAHQSTMELSMKPEETPTTTRLQFLQTATLATLLSTTTLLAPSPASAAKYGPLGAGSPEVLDPKSAIVDKEIFDSQPVQSAISSLRVYLEAVQSMQADLKKNSQADVGPTIRGKFDFVKLRADLNTANTALDEDTQRGTDRIGRLILQDITELEVANKQKEGIERSEKRLTIMTKKLDKLAKAFADYLAFYA